MSDTNMFCFQCEQTAGGKGCTRVGVCGKQPETAARQDQLTCELIALARASEGQPSDRRVDAMLMRGLFATITNVNFNPADLDDMIAEAAAATRRLKGQPAGDASGLFQGDPDIVSLRSILLFGLRGMAAYAWHARTLGQDDQTVTGWFYKGLRAVGADHSVDEWLGLIMEFGQANLKCMELLDRANTGAYGHPVPTSVPTARDSGPFIVVTGHDLHDLKQLLEQTEGKGINIYTHGEMLPAHAYPELKKYAHLKGNYGTAWQNQQKEFDKLPGVVLYTTNCLMPPKVTYMDRIFTTAMVGFPGVTHIPADAAGRKDFAPVIGKALALKGWAETTEGKPLMTGFGHNA
ncbi:MAG: hydroxylamine reductase, partial [Kiritimatiellae bacterium]|nr:hydroxylamine reductase [Kiritimatiellia bacterium]